MCQYPSEYHFLCLVVSWRILNFFLLVCLITLLTVLLLLFPFSFTSDNCSFSRFMFPILPNRTKQDFFSWILWNANLVSFFFSPLFFQSLCLSLCLHVKQNQMKQKKIELFWFSEQEASFSPLLWLDFFSFVGCLFFFKKCFLLSKRRLFLKIAIFAKNQKFKKNYFQFN